MNGLRDSWVLTGQKLELVNLDINRELGDRNPALTAQRPKDIS